MNLKIKVTYNIDFMLNSAKGLNDKYNSTKYKRQVNRDLKIKHSALYRTINTIFLANYKDVYSHILKSISIDDIFNSNNDDNNNNNKYDGSINLNIENEELVIYISLNITNDQISEFKIKKSNIFNELANKFINEIEFPIEYDNALANILAKVTVNKIELI